MKKQIKIFTLFAIAILGTFIPEQFPDFFGDWQCNGGYYDLNLHQYVGCRYGDLQHGAGTHWGFRHWLWFVCGATLFFYNLVYIFAETEEK